MPTPRPKFLARLCVFAVILCNPCSGYAQGIPIGALPNATLPLTGSEFTILSQNGVTVKATITATAAPALTIANNTVLGNVSGGTAIASAINAAQLSTLLGLGTAAFANTGTSGHALPYLDGGNTWSALQALSSGLNLSGTGSPLQLNGSAGTSGNPIISQGASTTPAFGTRSGNTTVFATTTGTLTSGNCVQIDASGNLVQASGVCGTGSGTVNSGTIGQTAYYAAGGTAVSGTSALTLTSTAVTIAPSGVLTIAPVTASAMDNVVIGGSTALAGSFTTASASTSFRGTDFGTGSMSALNLTTTAGIQMQVLNTALATRWITVTGSNGGNPTINVSAGSLAITPATVFASTISATTGTFSAGVTLSGTTSPLLANASPGTSGNVLTSSGPGNTPAWVAPVVYLAWGGVQNANFNAVVNTSYCVDTTSTVVTMTLPASPVDGDKVQFIDCKSKFSTNAMTVGRNAKAIMGISADMTVNTVNAASGMVYVSANSDWRLF